SDAALSTLFALVVAALTAGAGHRDGLILASGTMLGVAASALAVALMPEPAAEPAPAVAPARPAPQQPVRRRPARDTPRTPSAAPRTSRPASRRRPRSE